MSLGTRKVTAAFSQSFLAEVKKKTRSNPGSNIVLDSASSSNISSSKSSSSDSEISDDEEFENDVPSSYSADQEVSVCLNCNKGDKRSKFYGTAKLYCSYNCQQKSKTESDKAKPKISFKTKLNKISPKKIPLSKICKTAIEGSFDWRAYLNRPNFVAAPVQYFKHAQLAESWNNIVEDLKVEVLNNDWYKYQEILPKFYWVASVKKIFGYLVLLRYVGCDSESRYDFWVNLCMGDVHEIGWSKKQQHFLVPPLCIAKKQSNWSNYLRKTLSGTNTLPNNFVSIVQDSLRSNIQVGMVLEAIDKSCISCMRVANVEEVVGGRLHLTYAGAEETDGGFWCHERSPSIHPVGWSQIMNHRLISLPDYPRRSLEKVLYHEFEPSDAGWGLFMPVSNTEHEAEFKVGSKFEAIDPLNPSTICVSTVMKKLRNGYFMVGIDGTSREDGSDWFCYHASSPYIFPVSFCETNGIDLTPPPLLKNGFNWKTYLKRRKASAVPAHLFVKDTASHKFEVGMHLEATDIMDPHLMCVATITKIVGRLLRIHFDGWDEDYDQWCDCESPELYPIGWCDVVGYRLEMPPIGGDLERKKPTFYKGHRRRKRSNMIVQKAKSYQPPKKIRKLSSATGTNDKITSVK